jgi:hypothetical protein
MWEFSLYKIGQILLPFAKRKVGFIAWVKVYLSYLSDILDRLRAFRILSLRDARMTPQICYLEKYLRDLYSSPEITIVDGHQLGPWCFYHSPPSGDDDFYAVEPNNYCYANNVTINIDFVVEVPGALEAECNAIAAYVQKFKMVGKSFIIQLI